MNFPIYTRFADAFWHPIEQLPHRSDTWTVGRSMPGEGQHYLAIAFYDHETDIWWLHSTEEPQPLTWKPTYWAAAPCDPPWPPLDLLRKHGASERVLKEFGG